MSYPVKIGPAEVSVNTLDEAVELIAKYNQAQLAAAAGAAINGRRQQPDAEPEAQPAEASVVSLADFVANLPEWPQRGLRTIYEIGRGRPITADNLRENLGLRNNMALTGRVISPLTRNANRANIDPATVLTSERQRRPDGSGETVYSIPRDSLEAVKQGLGL